MTNTDTATLTELLDQHLQAYGEPDASLRDPVVRRIWASDGRLVDPPLEGQGHDAIVGLGDAVAQHFPGHTFVRTTAVDAHHEFARYGWELRGPDGAVAVNGIDVVTLADDGTIAQVVGFFGDLAPAS
jgi:hypothetical protein